MLEPVRIYIRPPQKSIKCSCRLMRGLLCCRLP